MRIKLTVRDNEKVQRVSQRTQQGLGVHSVHCPLNLLNKYVWLYDVPVGSNMV